MQVVARLSFVACLFAAWSCTTVNPASGAFTCDPASSDCPAGMVCDSVFDNIANPQGVCVESCEEHSDCGSGSCGFMTKFSTSKVCRPTCDLFDPRGIQSSCGGADTGLICSAVPNDPLRGACYQVCDIGTSQLACNPNTECAALRELGGWRAEGVSPNTPNVCHDIEFAREGTSCTVPSDCGGAPLRCQEANFGSASSGLRCFRECAKDSECGGGPGSSCAIDGPPTDVCSPSCDPSSASRVGCAGPGYDGSCTILSVSRDDGATSFPITLCLEAGTDGPFEVCSSGSCALGLSCLFTSTTSSCREYCEVGTGTRDCEISGPGSTCVVVGGFQTSLGEGASSRTYGLCSKPPAPTL